MTIEEQALGWPKGVDPETASWATSKVKELLTICERPLELWEIYHYLKSQNDQPQPFKRVALLPWLYDVTERAANECANRVYILKRPLSDPWFVIPASEKKSLTSRVGERTFVSGRDGAGRNKTYCPDCIPKAVLKRMGDDGVDTWKTGSHGWSKAPVCDKCKITIPVYVDG